MSFSTLRLKCGAVRADGKVFWCYNKGSKSGEWWVTSEKYEQKMARNRELYASRSDEIKSVDRAIGGKRIEEAKMRNGVRKHGEKNPKTGMVFWGYNSACRECEQWVTPEKFYSRKSKNRRWEAEQPLDSPRKMRRFHPDYRRKARVRDRKRRATDTIYALCRRVKCLTTKAFRERHIPKNSKTADILGCSWDHLKEHVESQLPPGMSWDNRSEWHIDHIIPLATAQTEEEIIRLCHWTNLQPLWAIDNIKKGTKLPPI